ncbi:MAG: isochorismatase family protein [Burkholderiales bacterium]|nr:isochorismatase family protein [Burkholderiales bacterium]
MPHRITTLRGESPRDKTAGESRNSARDNTKGAEIHQAVAPAAGETVVTKHFPSAFRETDLLDRLRAAGATRLAVAGMMTHMCVDTSVRAAADLGFQCLLAEDGCATRALQFGGREVGAPEVQLAYLAALNGAFAKVQPARTIASELG